MKILTILLFMINIAHAGIMSIPFDNSEYVLAPASDLVYQGNRINEIHAMELEQSGVDLSQLEPYTSGLYSGQKSKLTSTINIQNQKVIYHSSLKSPTEFYRASVNINGENFTISASLFNHQTMIRAGLLKLIGYEVELPQFKKNLKIHFNTLEEKKTFLETLAQSTLLARSRWIKNIEEDNDSKLYLDLSGVIIEPADLKSVPVYWPIMEESRQRKRRVFRSLIHLYALTDFPQQINRISWDLGKVFNNSLIFDHAYSNSFSAVTINDFRWFHRKINNLKSDEIYAAIKLAQYPKNIEKLVFEKLKSRLNELSKLIDFRANYKVNKKLNAINIVNGKLKSSEYKSYVPIFWEEDPLSPYRFSEIFKLFRSQITYDSISELLDTAMKRFVPGIDSSSAFENIREQIGDYRSKEGFIPLKVWSYPTFQGKASGSRSIVFGQYLGNNAPIQLVDSVQYKMNLGIFSYLSGLGSVGTITPTGSLNANLIRNYTHIRAMPDLTAATNQSLKKLFVPNLLKKLGTVLKDNIECSIIDNAWYTEEIVSTFRTWVVYYDKDIDTGKDDALALREKLISDGIEEDKILLSPVSKDELCEKEVLDVRSKNIDEFIKEFALDETITISDSIGLGGKIGAKVDISAVDQLKAQFTVGRNKALLRSYSIRKVSEGIEVTMQTQNNLTSSFEQGLKFYIDLVTNNTEWIKGKMISKVYKIKLEGISEEEKIAAINTLREILIRNSYSNLKEYYNPIDLTHQARVKLNTFKFFWRKSERLRMNQEVKIIVPNSGHNIEFEEEEDDFWSIPTQPQVDIPLEQRTRTLYTSMSFKRAGSNYHNFLDRLLNNRFSWLRIGSSDKDPGNSIYGKSKKRYYTTESELTEGAQSQTTIKVEYAHTGWSTSKKNLEQYLKAHEKYLNFDGSQFEIDRGQFAQTSELRSYDIRTTIILYPSAIEKMESLLIEGSDQEILSFFKRIYTTKKWDRYCNRRMRMHGNSGLHIYRGDNKKRYCVPKKFRKILKRKKYGFAVDKKLRNNQIHSLFESLFEGNEKALVLEFIGLENFFASTYIGGYRNNDVEGYLIYTSDTVGTYQQEFGTGLFDSISASLGLTPYLVKGMVYTPSM